MSLNRILSFDVNRMLRFDLNRLFLWRIPAMMLIAVAGWFLAAFALDVGILPLGLARAVSAASAVLFVLSFFHRRKANALPTARTQP